MRTKQDLKILQSLPLEVKIKKTIQRVEEFVNYFGEDGVYLSCGGQRQYSIVRYNT